MKTPEENLASLSIVLPPAPKPLGVYKPFLKIGNMVYVSGHGTVLPDGTLIRGRIGEDMDIEAGKKSAEQVGKAILATLKANLPSLDHIDRVVKILGMVNATSDFERHPYVINGCSELFASIWGHEKGVGVRSAVGMATLPDNIPVEIEAQFLLRS